MKEGGWRKGEKGGKKEGGGKILGSVLKINPSLLKWNESHACSISLSNTVEIHGPMKERERGRV